MCMISMVGDGWRDDFVKRWPQPYTITTTSGVSRSEFEALKREMQEIRELLLAAKKFDEATGQPDCETEDKVELIRQIAKAVGVDMSEVFGEPEA